MTLNTNHFTRNLAWVMTLSCTAFAAYGGSASGSSNPPYSGPPVITATSGMSVNEGQTASFVAATARLSPGRSGTWSVSGIDAARFSVDSATGALAFKAAPDYAAPADTDANNEYILTLSVSDGSNSASSAPLAVRVQPWNQGGASALPIPPVRSDHARPAGAAAKLRVLPWAGFAAAVSYTFDDSSPSQVEHWPDLKAQRVRSTFYVNPPQNWFANYDNTWKDALAQGFEIGNHTMHHCHFSDVGNQAKCSNSLATVAAEIDDTTTYIKNNFGQSDVWTFASPYGELGYQAAAQTRFLMARGVVPGLIGAGDNTDAFNLPAVYSSVGGDPVSKFNADIDSALTQGRWMVFLFHTLLPTEASNNWGLGEDIAVVTGSMTHAKALGNVWLDSLVNVGAYWQGQKLLQAATPVTAAGKTTWTWTLPAHFPPGRKLRVLVDGGTLSQNGSPLTWDGHGYYEISLDAQSLSWAP
jgi:peptidoglycan/xylan/chitin deacetylase (PgdA/CDA1 family)